MARQTKFIQLGGLSTAPSEFNTDNGNLAVNIGTVHENGALSPFYEHAPKAILDLPPGSDIIARHRLTGYDHFIIRSTDNNNYTYSWIDVPDKNLPKTSGDLAPVALPSPPSFECTGESIGNICILKSTTKNYYYRWNDNERDYELLGDHIPELRINFGLQCDSDAGTYQKYDVNNEGTTPTYEGQPLQAAHIVLDSTQGTAKEHDAVYAVCELHKYFNMTNDFDALLDGKTSLSEEDKEAFTTAVFGALSKWIDRECNEKGSFIFPFLLRYAYRLYDGSTTMESFPILMVPSTAGPIAGAYPDYIDYTIDRAFYYIVPWGSPCKLDMAILQSSLSDLIDNWGEIVKSIDIFVSLPFYTYDSTKQCTRTKGGNTPDTAFFLAGMKQVRGIYAGANATSGVCRDYRLRPVSDTLVSGLYKAYYTDPATIDARSYWSVGRNANQLPRELYVQVPSEVVDLPERDITDEVRSCGNFFLIKSFTLAELQEDAQSSEAVRYVHRLESDWLDMSFRKTITIEAGVLSSLATRETLNASYQSHDNIAALGSFVYNRRLIYYDIYRHLYDGDLGLRLSQLLPFQSFHNGTSFVTVPYRAAIEGTIGGEHFVAQLPTESLSPLLCIPSLFYSDKGADTFSVFAEKASDKYASKAYKLLKHDFLNVSAFFASLKNLKYFNTQGYAELEGPSLYGEEEKGSNNPPSESISPTIHLENLIYTSEADQPFTFLSNNIESVSNSKVLAVCPLTDALSEGQFGDYPLACFTSDGIWALAVNDTGGWVAKTVISRDILLDSSKILQLDKSIIFATARGLMQLTGSQTKCITEVFDDPDDIFINSMGLLPQIHQTPSRHVLTTLLPEAFGGGTYDLSWLTSFRDILPSCVMAYDYAHQRIIVGSPLSPLSYCFSIKDGMWSAVPLPLLYAIPSYPNALVAVKGNETPTESTTTKEDVTVTKRWAKAVEPDPNPVVTTTTRIEILSDGSEVTISTIVSELYESRGSTCEITTTTTVRTTTTRSSFATTIADLSEDEVNFRSGYGEQDPIGWSKTIDDPVLTETTERVSSMGHNGHTHNETETVIDDTHKDVTVTDSDLYYHGNAVDGFWLDTRTTVTVHHYTLSTLNLANAKSRISDNCHIRTGGIIVTRTFKLETALLSIFSINLEGVFAKGHAALVLYGTNDLAQQKWWVVRSVKSSRMHGQLNTPFKYYRLAVIANLNPGESITGFSVEYDVRESNKLRQ